MNIQINSMANDLAAIVNQAPNNIDVQNLLESQRLSFESTISASLQNQRAHFESRISKINLRSIIVKQSERTI